MQGERVALSFDREPKACALGTAIRYADPAKSAEGWEQLPADFSVATTQLPPALRKLGVSERAVRAILAENARRVLAF